MGFQFDFTDENTGLSVPAAYARIDAETMSWSGGWIQVTLDVWTSAQGRFTALAPLRSVTIQDQLANLPPGPIASDVRDSIYAWLKVREPGVGEIDFRGAVDVIEQ